MQTFMSMIVVRHLRSPVARNSYPQSLDLLWSLASTYWIPRGRSRELAGIGLFYRSFYLFKCQVQAPAAPYPFAPTSFKTHSCTMDRGRSLLPVSPEATQWRDADQKRNPTSSWNKFLKSVILLIIFAGGWKNSTIENFWGGRRSLNCFMLRKEKTANRTQVL